MSDCPNCDAGELYPTTPGWVVCRNCGSTWRTAVWYMDVTDEHEMSDDTVRNLHSVDGLLGLIRYRKETLSDTELDLSIGHVRSAIERIAELGTQYEPTAEEIEKELRGKAFALNEGAIIRQVLWARNKLILERRYKDATNV